MVSSTRLYRNCAYPLKEYFSNHLFVGARDSVGVLVSTRPAVDGRTVSRASDFSPVAGAETTASLKGAPGSAVRWVAGAPPAAVALTGPGAESVPGVIAIRGDTESDDARDGVERV